MHIDLKTLAVILAALGASPALADSQLVANAGLTPAEAEGMSLTEIAAAKFSRDDRSEPQAIVTPGSGGDVSQLAASAGMSPAEASGLTLTEIAAVKFNRDADGDDAQRVRRGGGAVMASRSADTARWSQLAASAGLSPEEARGMSLTEIAVAKFNRNVSGDERQGL